MGHPGNSHKKLREMSERFSNSGLANKLTIVVYSGFAMVFLFLTILMIFFSQQSNAEKIRRQGQEFLNSGQSLLLEEMQYIKGIGEYISLTKDIQQEIHDSNRGIKPLTQSDTLSVVQKQRFVVSVVTYNLRGQVVDYFALDSSSGPVAQPVDDPGHPIYNIINENKAYVWQYIPDKSQSFMLRDYSPKLCIWHRVLDNKTLDVIGAIAVNVDVRKLIDAGPRPGRPYYSIIIINSENEEVFNRTGIPLNTGMIEAMNALRESSDEQVDTMQINGTPYYAFSTSIANTYLKLIYLVPSNQSWNISGLFIYVIAAVALFILLLLPLYYYLTKSVTKPLKKLIASMMSFSQGETTQQVRFRHQDEVGLLGNAFDSIIDENKRLINANYMLKLKEKEAALATLQAQIKPHFLYNVINSIQWLAVKDNNKEVANLIYSLGKMFQHSVNVDQGMTSVEQEIDLVQNYLKLQKQCSQNRFDYTINIGEGVRDASIPRFCIQPVVENSILHAVENGSEMVQIAIDVHLSGEENQILIEVTDNGPGIQPEVLKLLPDRLPQSKPSGKAGGNRLAIRNIYERLSILYKGNFQFTITSIPKVQTKTSITLPIDSINVGLDKERHDEHVWSSPDR